MKRPTRLTLPVLLLAAMLVPAAGHTADEKDQCRLMEDAPAYVCSGAGTYRTATTFARGRGYTMVLFAFEFTGQRAPAGSAPDTGVCVAVVRGRGVTEACDLPFEVAFDPMLESATIKGSVKTKQLGTIVADLSANAIEETAASPWSFADLDTSCSDIASSGGVGSLSRHGETSGSVKAGKTATRFRNAETHLSQHIGGGGSTILSLPCAPERATEDGYYFLLDCIAAGLPPAGYAAACDNANHERIVSVTAKSKTATVRVTAAEGMNITPSPPDPSWISPQYVAPSPYSSLCVTIRTRAMLSLRCGGEYEIEMDPLLRTARIKGQVGGWGGDYVPPPPFGPPFHDAYGRIDIDLTAAVGEQGPQPSGRSRTIAMAVCDGVLSAQVNSIMQGDGTASGTIAFQRKLGTFRGSEAKPLPATMDWTQSTLVAAFTYPDACGSGGDEY